MEITTTMIEALVELRVPRGEMGDLPSGVRDVLTSVEAVHAVELQAVRGVRPTSFDLRVTATVRLDVAADPDRADQAVADGFGVEHVERATEYG
jgi:Asp-tRNA(Asn)/Glu-tRNA(Gln) amidotransferase C subunit